MGIQGFIQVGCPLVQCDPFLDTSKDFLLFSIFHFGSTCIQVSSFTSCVGAGRTQAQISCANLNVPAAWPGMFWFPRCMCLPVSSTYLKERRDIRHSCNRNSKLPKNIRFEISETPPFLPPGILFGLRIRRVGLARSLVASSSICAVSLTPDSTDHGRPCAVGGLLCISAEIWV